MLRPDHCIFVSNASGTFEIYTWDRTTGATQQVTTRATGTTLGTIDPTGEWIWWFDDRDGDEFGIWRKIPFDYALTGGSSPPEAVPGLPPSYPSGLSLGPDGLAIIGRSTDVGAALYAAMPDHDARLLYSHAQHASVIALSRDGTLVAIEHSEHGDTRHPALRVLKVADGAAVADLFDGPGDSGLPLVVGSNRPKQTTAMSSFCARPAECLRTASSSCRPTASGRGGPLPTSASPSTASRIPFIANAWFTAFVASVTPSV